MARTLLNAEEEQYIGSLKSIVLVDPNDIRILAEEAASSEYLGLDPKPIRAAEYVVVTGYVGYKPKVSFAVWYTDLRLKDGPVYRIFRNDRFMFCLDKRRPQVRPFEYRVFCAHTLQSLRWRMRHLADRGGTYPTPSQWCDAIERFMRAGHLPENDIKWAFVCSAIREGRCHYAMNPNCEPNSPPDTVLLFETKAGWNQHGGPELFTFDNHDPRGGCVLFNDGSVKFIRTEEDLKQLRWE